MTRSGGEWGQRDLEWEGCDSWGTEGEVEWCEIVL
jgi:hypothetical protein